MVSLLEVEPSAPVARNIGASVKVLVLSKLLILISRSRSRSRSLSTTSEAVVGTPTGLSFLSTSLSSPLVLTIVTLSFILAAATSAQIQFAKQIGKFLIVIIFSHPFGRSPSLAVSHSLSGANVTEKDDPPSAVQRSSISFVSCTPAEKSSSLGLVRTIASSSSASFKASSEKKSVPRSTSVQSCSVPRRKYFGFCSSERKDRMFWIVRCSSMSKSLLRDDENADAVLLSERVRAT
mmetsp:Transcript_8374/g.10472  ORF Transcript_8374/g.10472 Transcript_8374/m.10472 type:complete len:236 (-) Transcript_8374:219-926(-)